MAGTVTGNHLIPIIYGTVRMSVPKDIYKYVKNINIKKKNFTGKGKEIRTSRIRSTHNKDAKRIKIVLQNIKNTMVFLCSG